MWFWVIQTKAKIDILGFLRIYANNSNALSGLQMVMILEMVSQAWVSVSERDNMFDDEMQ